MSSARSPRQVRVALITGALSFGLVVAAAQAAAPGGRFRKEGSTVVDTKTGLTWQEPASATGYAWAAAQTYCTGMGAAWRLPNVKELMTLVDIAAPTTKLDTSFFKEVATQGAVWTSTKQIGAADRYWVVEFTSGRARTEVQTATGGVRCVK